MRIIKKVAVLAATIGLLVVISAGGSTAAVPAQSPQVLWAERLLREVAPDRNVYGSRPTIVRWAEDGKGPAANRSVCSSFVTHVFERAYGFNRIVIRQWFGKSDPRAIDYVRTIDAGRGFEPVLRVTAIQAGDVIAIAYPPGGESTGHVMLADGVAAPRVTTAPLEPGLRQYEIAVIDSSRSGHGFSDTRMLVGSRKTGVGRGTLRLYAAQDGMISGYSWSTRADSQFYPNNEHPIVVGRFTTPTSSSLTAGAGGDDAVRGEAQR
ncbi:MAG TPA: hypothetical protein VEP50_14635 [bacterium]|nr:hypothetical protein [bacterium]